jgi:hypothetical protein
VGRGVHFTGFRHEAGGSVLRFQGTRYTEIYEVLPDLLAPFRMAKAIDWKSTAAKLPAGERSEAITILALRETKTVKGRWRFAERMAQIFAGSRDARVYQIREGKSQAGIRIDIFTNREIAERLATQGLPDSWDHRQPLQITPGDNANILIGEANMENATNAQGTFIGAAIGSQNAINARDITAYIDSLNKLEVLDPQIKEALIKARKQLDSTELSPTDKEDVADDLGKITDELKGARPNPGRVKRLFKQIVDLAPSVASILTAVAKFAELLKPD